MVVIEELLRLGRRGALLRPFCQQAQVRPRGYSKWLQAAITDFGAEGAFAQVSARLQCHYGITVPDSSARRVTLQHGQQMQGHSALAASASAAVLVTEMDGSLIPIVESASQEAAPDGDRRRGKTLHWKEARLSAALVQGCRQARFGATMGSVLEAGLQWEQTARQAGLAATTRVHGVGDGAPWIADRFDLHFGAQGRYLVDLWHVGEYLAAAAPGCAPSSPAVWREQQQHRLKSGQLEQVLAEIVLQQEPETKRDKSVRRRADEPSLTPVRDCYRYLHERRQRLDYAAAIRDGLPIGSGLIESGHRHVIQARLKRAGAWWKEESARKMLALRVLRANGEWDRYWNSPQNLKN